MRRIAGVMCLWIAYRAHTGVHCAQHASVALDIGDAAWFRYHNASPGVQPDLLANKINV